MSAWFYFSPFTGIRSCYEGSKSPNTVFCGHAIVCLQFIVSPDEALLMKPIHVLDGKFVLMPFSYFQKEQCPFNICGVVLH